MRERAGYNNFLKGKSAPDERVFWMTPSSGKYIEGGNCILAS
jgi:hypothetical protein